MYAYVSAGATYPTYGGMNLFVRYKKRKGEFEEIDFNSGKLIKLFDREVFIVNNANRDNMHPTFLQSFDFAVDADYFGANSACKHTGLMFIYEPQQSARRHNLDKNAIGNRKLYVDSGGFKLATGTEEFIHPLDLATYYNKYAKQGMALDIPLRGISDLKMLYRHADIQVLNSKMMVPALDDSVTLYNISHGINEDLRKRYIERVYRDDLDHWSVGGPKGGGVSGNINPLDFTNRALLTVSEAGGLKKVKGLHLLGVANIYVIPLLAWLGRYIDLTTDASTSVQKAVTLRKNEFNGKILRSARVGYTESEIYTLDKTPHMMTCNCNICFALGSNELFYKSNNTIGAKLLQIHNTTVMSQYSLYWSELAEKLSLEDFKKQYLFILKSMNVKRELYVHYLLAIDYIEEFVTNGLAKADKKYRVHKTTNFGNMLSNTPLFQDDTAEEDNTQLIRKNLLKAVERYESFHKKNKTKQKY